METGSEKEAGEVKQRHSLELLQQPGVCGVGVQKDDSGHFVIAIHLDTDDPDLQSRLPQRLEGYPVIFIRSGPFRAQANR